MTTPTPPTNEGDDQLPIEQLASRMTQVLNSTEGIRSEMERENERTRKRIRTQRLGIVAIAALAVVAIIVGIRGSLDQREAKDELKRARVASCLQDNRRQKAEAEAQVKASENLVAALADGRTDPQTVARAAAFNKDQDALIRQSHPQRNCTDAGIKAYLGATGSPS